MDETIIQKIKFEIAQIDREIDESEPLLALCKLKEPDRKETLYAGNIGYSSCL